MPLFPYFKIVSLISVCPMGRNQYVCKLIPFHKNKKDICIIDYIKGPFFQLSFAKGMEDALTHAPDEPQLNNDRSNQCDPSSPNPQGARPALATHLQPDNKKSSRTNSNFSISSLIKRPQRQSTITKNVEGVFKSYITTYCS